MQLSEFQKQQLPAGQADRWIWHQRVDTALASFQVELLMMDDEDTAPPDEAMVRLAEELAEFTRQHTDEIWDIVHGYYLMGSENPSWMSFCEVPEGLDRAAMKPAVIEPGLVIMRHAAPWPPRYDGAIRVKLKWKMEHIVWLNFNDGKITGEVDRPFYLENGVLRYVPEEPVPPPPPVVPPPLPTPARKRRTIDPSWLKVKMTVAEVEAKHVVELEDDDGTKRRVPFGYCNRDWAELVSLMQDGDELWSYSSSDESWANLAGRMGYVLLRDDEVIAGVLTAMN